MPSDIPDGIESGARRTEFTRIESVEYLLFDSLVHHMIEKGLLTKNDALSVVQAVAQIVRGYACDEDMAVQAQTALSGLERLYSSFEAIPNRARSDASNLTHLRPPLHEDRPEFPSRD